GYTGKAFDPDTALQNNINRWYDPAVGRWLSTDPIGFYGNDVNLYRYVENSPVLLFDPMGWVDFRELTKTLKAMCQCNIEAIKKQGMSPKIDMNRLPQLESPQIEEILADSDFRTKLDNLFEEYRKTGALVLGLPDIKVIQLHQIQGNGAVIQNHYGPIFLIINDISHIKKVEIQKNILHELQHFFDYNNPNLNIDLSNMTPKHLALLELRAYYFSGQCSSFEECVKGLVASVCLPFGKPYLSPEDFSPIFLQEMEDYFNRMKQWE
ncbi:MAG: RHS repeat-associated core domain-containing protein, partial [Thermoguttaceae bacterium]|nr:RHS repeat-associated core domain-containing protein [Thermoguttaceae bacterium]